MHDVELATFSEMEEHQLAVSLLPLPVDKAQLMMELEWIASSYRAGRLQPPAPKALVKASLEALAEHAAAFRADGSDLDAQLRLELGALPNEALSMLWTAAKTLPGDPWAAAPGLFLPDSIDWTVIAAASLLAAQHCKGGDYADRTLHGAISELIDIFLEQGGKPSMSGNKASPSELCVFVRTFFEVVDPDLEKTAIDSALDQAHRRRSRRVNLSKPGSRAAK